MDNINPSEGVGSESGRGVALALVAFLLEVAAMFGLAGVEAAPRSEPLSQSAAARGMVFIIGPLLTVIWIPIAVVAGQISRRKGLKSLMWYLTAAFFVILLGLGGSWAYSP